MESMDWISSRISGNGLTIPMMKIRANFTNKGVGAMYQSFGYIENVSLRVFDMKE